VPAVRRGVSASARPETVIAALGGITYTWLGESNAPSSIWLTGIAVSLESKCGSMLS
jgi:hypothetical protein